MHPYRIFISYSHDDEFLARTVAEHFEKALALVPLWDSNIRPGRSFSDDIGEMISFSHVFVPLLTESSAERPWVHQEIGYAMALGIPVLPLGFGRLPIGMTRKLKALSIKKDLSDLVELLTGDVIEQVVDQAASDIHYPTLRIALHPEDRTLVLNEHLRTVLKMGGPSKIRHASAFGSFSLPRNPPKNEIWDRRDANNKRSLWLRGKFRRERILMEEHAKVAGCDLIIDPSVVGDNLTSDQKRARIEVLIAFLNSMTDDKIRVVIGDKHTAGNLIIVGDWFAAESSRPSFGIGFQDTVLNRHAPTVMTTVHEFDAHFEASLSLFVKKGQSSRLKALDNLKSMMAKLE